MITSKKVALEIALEEGLDDRSAIDGIINELICRYEICSPWMIGMMLYRTGLREGTARAAAFDAGFPRGKGEAQ